MAENSEPVSAAPPIMGRPQDKGLLVVPADGNRCPGFVALLTPCVFPMVPITVSFFLKQE